MTKLLALAVLFLSIPAHADYSSFKEKAKAEYLTPFALDLGGILGAAETDTGVSWGFPGVEAGVVVGAQLRPSGENRILTDSSVKEFGLPLVRVGVGLPFDTGVFAHGMQAQGVKIIGGGARWTVFKAPVVGGFLPSAGISLAADDIRHDAFKGRHYAANASVGWGLPIITPFVEAGLDWTRVEVVQTVVPGLDGMSAWSRGARFAAGADLTPMPFLRLRAAYQLLHQIPGFTAGLLFKF